MTQLTQSPMWHAWLSARACRLLLLGALLLAALLRFHALAAQSLWHDEGNTLRLIQRALPELLSAASRDIHPPLYYLLLKAWSGLTGESEFALRAFSALSGVLSVACAYALGAALFAPSVGIAAAFLTALNTFSIYYSQEARMYALLALIAALAMLCFVRWLDARRPSFLLGMALCNAAGLYTHYAYPLNLAAQGALFALWLVARRERGALGAYLAANALTVALFLPQLPIALAQLSGWRQASREALGLFDQLGTIGTWLLYGNTFERIDGALIALTLMSASLGAAAGDWSWRSEHAAPSLWQRAAPTLWLSIGVLLFLAFDLYRTANLKFLLPMQIAAALLVGRGLWVLWELGAASRAFWQRAVPRCAALLLGYGLLSAAGHGLHNLYNNAAYARSDYRALAAYIAREARQGDAILLSAPNQIEVFTYYYAGGLPLYGVPEGLGGDDAQTRRQTEAIVAAHRRLFAIFWGEAERDPNRIVEQVLSERAYEIDTAWFGDVRLVRYAMLGPLGAPRPIMARFGESITLREVALSAERIAAGDVLGVALTWQTDQRLTERYRVSVQLLDSFGRLAAQRDAEPGNNRALTTLWQPNEPVRDTHGVLLAPDLPRGEYQVSVVLYALDDGARLPVNGGGALIVGTVQVE
ncbi:MAG: glycosyltransferase family 39 protein [Chloroflexi bacterium]|nr:glycosyltransferase family 39 protein [Chloroflexota bacterium]